MTDPGQSQLDLSDQALSEREARLRRLRAFRLVPDEARRVIVTALLCLPLMLAGAVHGLRSAPSASRALVSNANDVPVPAHQKILLGVPIDLNTADARALQMIPGIGPSLSVRIVTDRDTHGAFASLADVERVKGIGPKLAGVIASHATATPR